MLVGEWVQALVGDLVDGRLPGVLGVRDSEREIGEHQLAGRRVAQHLEDQPPAPVRAGQGGLQAVRQARAVAPVATLRAAGVACPTSSVSASSSKRTPNLAVLPLLGTV